MVAFSMSILPVNWAEPVSPTGVPAVSRSRSGAVPEISRLPGVRPKSANVPATRFRPKVQLVHVSDKFRRAQDRSTLIC